MTFFEAISYAMQRLAVFEELDVDASQLPSAVVALSDRSVRDALAEATGAIQQLTVLQTLLAGVASARSGRDRGHSGLVQESGHRSPVEFIRDTTGVTWGEAIRMVKTGESLLQGTGAAPVAGPVEGPDPGSSPGPGPVEGSQGPDRPWHHPLDRALLSGRITTAQHDVIRRGLGDPPTIPGRTESEVAAAWRSAATQLLAEAPMCTVEDLRGRARTLRDLADPEGAASRHQALFDRRAYRSWTDADGMRNAKITYDPEMGAWTDHGPVKVSV